MFFGGICFAKTQDKQWRLELLSSRPEDTPLDLNGTGRGFHGAGDQCEVLARVCQARVYMEIKTARTSMYKFSSQVKSGLNIYFISRFPLQF